MCDLPKEFIDWMGRQLGSELSAFLRSYDAPYLRGVRRNPMKPMAEAIEGEGEPVPWAEYAAYLAVDSQAGLHPLHEAGAYYIQEPSAMLPAAVLNARPGETVLDLCAAPGGKSTQLALAMGGQGLIVCNEPVPKRAQILSRNVERMGIPNALVVSAMPDQLAKRWPEGFDAVQVDAPCSGEGMFRRHPETRAEWTLENRDGCAARQLEILEQAARMVRPGGRMVYSTCTLNTVENEGVVSAFLAAHPDFSAAPFALPGAEGLNGMLTCYPHRMRGEGQFVAKLVRTGAGEASLPADASLPRPDKAQLAALRAFAADAPLPTAVLGDTLVCLPGCPDVRGLKVLRCGLHLGQVKGKLFLPDHAWAVAACPPGMPRAALTAEQALRYQAGETVQVDPSLKGYVLPALAGLPLGWGKVTDGVMKNHYPKGLRRP